MMNEENGIIEFTFRPKTDGKRPLPTVLLIAALSAVLMVVSANIPMYKGVVSLGAVVGICASLYLAMRYIMSDLIYTVYGSGEQTPAQLMIYRAMGRRESLMYRLDLADIKDIKVINKSDKTAHAPTRGATKLNFCPNFNPDSYYLLIAKSTDVDIEMKLEITPEVRTRLLAYAEIARNMKRAEE